MAIKLNKLCMDHPREYKELKQQFAPGSEQYEW